MSPWSGFSVTDMPPYNLSVGPPIIRMSTLNLISILSEELCPENANIFLICTKGEKKECVEMVMDLLFSITDQNYKL